VQELLALGWISGPLPRLVAVQSTGCAPIVRAFRPEQTRDALGDTPHDRRGIRVPAALGDFLMLRALRDSGGFALAVPDSPSSPPGSTWIAGWLLLSPEGAATYAAYLRAAASASYGRPSGWSCSIAPAASSIRCRR